MEDEMFGDGMKRRLLSPERACPDFSGKMGGEAGCEG